MKLTKIVGSAAALAVAGVALLALRRAAQHPERAPPSWVTRLLTFA